MCLQLSLEQWEEYVLYFLTRCLHIFMSSALVFLSQEQGGEKLERAALIGATRMNQKCKMV